MNKSFTLAKGHYTYTAAIIRVALIDLIEEAAVSNVKVFDKKGPSELFLTLNV